MQPTWLPTPPQPGDFQRPTFGSKVGRGSEALTIKETAPATPSGHSGACCRGLLDMGPCYRESESNVYSRILKLRLNATAFISTSVGLVVVGMSYLLLGFAQAMAPGYVTDKELAHYPIIVEAKWEKAAFRRHSRVEGDVVKESEAFTSLHILRVIKGDIKPGVHTLMVVWGIGWDEDGRVSSGTSTTMLGDAENVMESNLWFLKPSRSWDATDKKEYLKASNYREVQPMVFEDYYAAFRLRNPDEKFASFLADPKGPVIWRVLGYVNGWQTPWPFDPAFEMMYDEKPQGKVLKQHAKAIAAVALRKELGEGRAQAAAVYASMMGAKSLPLLRGLLTDSNPFVREVAAGLLARNKDIKSINEINSIITEKTDSRLVIKIIEAVSAWGDVRLVPALLSSLDNGTDVYTYGDDLGVPCIKARDALHRMTGHWFPYETKPSRLAWEQASLAPNSNDRLKLLKVLIPCNPNPLRAKVTSLKIGEAICSLTNRSERPVVITKSTYAMQDSDGGSSGISGAPLDAGGEGDFVTIPPGKSYFIKLPIEERFIRADPATRRLMLIYSTLATDQGPGAWMGNVEIECSIEATPSPVVPSK